MSVFGEETVKCSVCGAVVTVPVVRDTSQLGSPDLDLRPPEMMRSTMFTWVQRCPVCGYCAEDISEASGVERAQLSTSEYLECGFCFLASERAKLFYRAALLYREQGRAVFACRNFLRAAWCEDDEKSEHSACSCREEAAKQLEQTLEQEPENKDELTLILADILRRSGRSDELRERFGKTVLSDPLHAKILKFQLRRARVDDREAYTINDVLPQ